MAERVTLMKLKVDLQCHRCHKKVKKVLAKFPQIRDQVYDEKQNIVIIKVVCCDPEKIRDKICCKGGGAIKSIEILEQPKPKPPEKKKEEPGEKPEASKDNPKKKQPTESKTAPKVPVFPPPPQVAPMVPIYPSQPPTVPPVGFCCDSCYHGQAGGPCFYDARPVWDSYSEGRLCHASRCDQYYYNQSPSGCSVM